MKRKFKHILSGNFPSGLLIVLIFLLSCTGGEHEEYYNEQGNLVVKEWYNRSSLKSSITYLDTGLKNYLYVAYHPDGRLKDSAKYINDTIEGLRKFYDPSAGLTHYENYRNGILNGVHKAEYNSGVTSFEGFRKNNQMVGEWKFHFLSGKPITYEYYDSIGKLLYFRKYDENENVLKATGTELINVFTDHDGVSVNEICSGYVEAATPNHCELFLTIAEGSSSQVLFSKNIENPITYWEIIFDDPGEKKLEFNLLVKDKKSGDSQSYSIHQNIMVIAD
ncbi:MAG: hypothetical protein R2764_19325 [Bacteroidales bacterium]